MPATLVYYELRIQHSTVTIRIAKHRQLQLYSLELVTVLPFKVLETGLPPYLAKQLCLYASTTAFRSFTSKVPHTNL